MAGEVKEVDPTSPSVSGRPDVSVLIIAHSRRQYLRRAITSVKSQNLGGTRCELVVLKSFDDKELEASMTAPDIHMITLPEGTLGEHLARGITECSGDVVSFLDDDDTFCQEKVAWVASHFDADPALAYLHNGYDLLRDDGTKVRRLIHPTNHIRLKIQSGPHDPRIVETVVRKDLAINLSSLSMRRAILLQKLEQLRSVRGASDYCMFYTALASGGSLLFEPNRLTIYYVHPSSMRPGGRRSDPAEFVRTLAEFQLQTQDYGLTLPKESGVGRAAAALHSEWELVLALVSQTSRRTAVRRFVEFVKRGWASRKRLVVMASFVMCAKLIFPHFGESLFLAMRQIIQD